MKELNPSIPLALLIEESADFEKNLAELGLNLRYTARVSIS